MDKINNKLKSNNIESQNTYKEFFGFLKWILKTELLIIIIIFIIKLTFNLIPAKTKYNFSKNIKEYDNSNYTYLDIENAIDANKNLEKTEKEFIKKYLKDEIEENLKYIDLKGNISKIKNVKISYHKKYDYNDNKYILLNEKMYKNNIAGRYNEFTNKIDVYENLEYKEIPDNYINTNFSFETCNKEVCFHEINHLISKNSFYSSITSNKNIISEAINELFTREYFKEENIENDAYDEYMYIAYILAEILPDEIIRKYKFYENENILISGLLEIDNNFDEAYKLIDSIKKINSAGKENYVNIQNGLNYFYEKKNNKKIIEDINILLYLYNSPIENIEERRIVEKYLNENNISSNVNIIPKGYVGNDYIQNHKKINISYNEDGIYKLKEVE